MANISNQQVATLIDALKTEKDPEKAQRIRGALTKVAKEQPPQDISLGQALFQAIGNIPSSGAQAASDLVQPILHPIETAQNVYKLGSGAVQKLIPGEQKNEKYADALGDYFADRYGGFSEFKQTLANDPVGLALDASAILTGGGTVAAKAPGLVGKIGGAVQRAGEATDLISAAPKAATAATGGVVNMFASPEVRASNKVATAAAKVSPQDATQRIADLGQEGMVIDVLGADGASLGRGAANISPDARQTLEGAVNARKAGQTDRVVNDLTSAAGMSPDTRMSVEEVKRADLDRARPAINQAYENARADGFDLPRSPFEDILQTPLGAQAYKDAAAALQNRAPIDGFNATSELARLDETKKILDSIASSAFRSGDNNLADQASKLSTALRDRIDGTIAGPEYSQARQLRQDAYKSAEAFDLGVDLARPTVPINAPSQARALDQNQSNVSQAFVLSKMQQLLNKNGKPGDLARMQTPLGQEAMSAALGPNAPAVQAGLNRESIFNETARALQGNSTTARQIRDNELSVADGMTMIGDVKTGGLVSGLRNAATRAGEFATGNRKANEAPFIADYLTQKTVPQRQGVKYLEDRLQEGIRATTPVGQASYQVGRTSQAPERNAERLRDILREMYLSAQQ